MLCGPTASCTSAMLLVHSIDSLPEATDVEGGVATHLHASSVAL